MRQWLGFWEILMSQRLPSALPTLNITAPPIYLIKWHKKDLDSLVWGKIKPVNEIPSRDWVFRYKTTPLARFKLDDISEVREHYLGHQPDRMSLTGKVVGPKVDQFYQHSYSHDPVEYKPHNVYARKFFCIDQLKVFNNYFRQGW